MRNWYLRVWTESLSLAREVVELHYFSPMGVSPVMTRKWPKLRRCEHEHLAIPLLRFLYLYDVSKLEIWVYGCIRGRSTRGETLNPPQGKSIRFVAMQLLGFLEGCF